VGVKGLVQDYILSYCTAIDIMFCYPNQRQHHIRNIPRTR